MIKRKKYYGIVTAVITGALLTPMAASASTTPVMQKSSIVVNGQHFSTQYKFVYDGTTYMPIYYVMQVMNKIKGFSAVWNGSLHKWFIDGPFGMPTLNLNSKSGQTSILMNGKVVESNIDTLVSTDPASGKKTTFMPIWYIQQALNAAGFNSRTDAWNGVTGNWSLQFSESSTSSTSSAPTNAEITSAIEEYLKESNYATKNISGYSPLATATQWYPMPGNIFFDKQIPLSDFVNNKVIQQKPFTIMSYQGGGYWAEFQYVGKQTNGTTWWEVENLNRKTGLVTQIYSSLLSFPASDKLPTPSSGGYHFTGAPVNISWAYGGNLYVIDPPGYNPNSLM
ncbi:MAG: hypothetical protein OWQ59_04100 [Alicyclobacillaceae bacterium]|nr:hypothetical protein [Alicyclobacillaceae bacterium]